MAGDVAYQPAAAYLGRLRGECLNLLMTLSGNRFGRGLVRPGGVVFDIDADCIVLTRADGGGGLGDPLLRPMEKVLADVQAGLVSRRLAEQVYGVVLDQDAEHIDPEATERLRDRIRGERLPTDRARAASRRERFELLVQPVEYVASTGRAPGGSATSVVAEGSSGRPVTLRASRPGALKKERPSGPGGERV